MSKTKTCSGCGEAKSLSQFRPRPERPVGYHSKCRDCERERSRISMAKKRAEDPEFRARQREASRQWREDPKNQDRVRQTKSTAAQRKRVREYSKHYRTTSEGRLKERARSAVNMAIQRGDLVRPEECSRCEKKPGKARDGRSLIRAHHHNGYDKAHWLDVEWVCASCDMKKEGEERCETST